MIERLERALLLPILLRPKRVARSLERIRAASPDRILPNEWQLSLGVLRMWQRILFRSDTVGTCADGTVRQGWRARALSVRALRLPALLIEGAVAPFDLTGLASSPAKIIRHILGAHHDGEQVIYDLEILACYPGALEALRAALLAIVEERDPRAAWMRDLVVFDGYHEQVLRIVERVRRDGPVPTPDAATNPDLSFAAYLDWCARQPNTLLRTVAAWRDRGLNEELPC